MKPANISTSGEATPGQDPFAGPIVRVLWRLVVPMFFGMVMIALVGIVDAYFIGMLGTEALAAFGLCHPAVMLMQTLMFGLVTGVTASVARARGRAGGTTKMGPEDQLRVRTAVLLLIALALVLAGIGATMAPRVFSAAAEPAVVGLALQYYFPYLLSLVCMAVPMSITACMRGFGETRSSGTVMMLASILNAGLDPLFMFGWGPLPAYGMAGAAMSTVVAYVVAASYALRLVQKALAGAQNGPATNLSAGAVIRDIAAVGVPSMLAQALGPVAATLVTGVVAGFGAEALAGLGIMQRVDMLVMIVAVATGAGLMPLAGQLAGKGDMASAAQALRLARRSMVVWGLGAGVMLNLAVTPLTALFTQEPAVASVVRLGLLFAPLGYVSAGLNITTMSGFNAVGRPMIATKLSAVMTLLLLPGGLYVGRELFGLPGIFGGVVVGGALTALIGTQWLSGAGLVPPTARASSVEVV